jgi:predicted amidohydrolase
MTSVTLLQISTDDAESVSDRIKRVTELTKNWVTKSDWVVLPELWHVGAFSADLFESHALPAKNELVDSFCEIAKSAGAWLHFGSFVERHEKGISNTSVTINPAGEIVSKYRKIHLFGFDKGEAIMLSRGEKPEVISTTELGAIGVSTCYDLRFPELYRAQIDQGAETFLISSGWPTPRISHWRTLITARAIENQAWVIACNQVGQNNEYTLGGNSMVVNPMGEVVAELGTGEDVLTVDIDVTVTRNWREKFPVLKDRVL